MQVNAVADAMAGVLSAQVNTIGILNCRVALAALSS